MNTEYFLPQIADVLERIESHLAVIARLLAAQQRIPVTILSNGQSIIGDIRPGDTQVAYR